MTAGDMEGGMIDEMDGHVMVLRYFKIEWSKDHLIIGLFSNPPASGKIGDGGLFSGRKDEITSLTIHKNEASSLEFGGLSIRITADTTDKGELVDRRSEIFIDDKATSAKDGSTHPFHHHFVVDIERYTKCLVIKDRHGNSITIRIKDGKLDWTGQGNIVRYKKSK